MSKPFSQKTITVLMTGGHLTPAVATIEALNKYHTKIIFVGRTQTDIQGTPSHEATTVTKLGAEFISFNAPKLYRKPFHLNFTQLPLIFNSLKKANSIIESKHPDVIISFGGYLALPIALMARLKGIPVIIHEQTLVVGLTNQLLSKLASEVFVSWPSTKKAPKSAKVIGNPLRSEIISKGKQPSWSNNPQNLPILYITGGNQGSVAINDQIEQILDDLTQQFFVIHQTGSARDNYSFKKLSRKREQLPIDQQQRYVIKEWVSALEVAWLLAHARLVISRSGANTTTELLIHHTPAILVPLPISARNEQYQNALLLEKLGLAKVLDQEKLPDLLKTIKTFLKSQDDVDLPAITKLKKLHIHAAETLAKEIISCVTLPKN